MQEYDFGLTWCEKEKEHFTTSLKDASAKKNLSFLWIYDENVRDLVKRLESGDLKVKFLLDNVATYAEEKDPYTRVCYAVKDNGGVIVNDPDRAKIATDKSIMHYELVNAGITTPFSVIIRNWQPADFKLTKEEKEKLGKPFVIKPASGYARQGVIQNARSTIRAIARARNFDPGDNFLLQEKIEPTEFGGRRAWFRVFHIFDTIIPCWWDDRTSVYEHVSESEFKDYRLAPLARIVAKIADIMPMVWFSTEIAIDRKFGAPRFVAIDYVNDQCDMTAQSQDKAGVPDAIVAFIAKSIVDTAYNVINGKPIKNDYMILFRGNKKIHLRGLGDAPEPLAPAQNDETV